MSGADSPYPCGCLEGFEVDFTVSPHTAVTAHYRLAIGGETVDIESVLGCGIRLSRAGPPVCLACARTIQKRYGGGYCYDCFSQLARCDLCVVSPERCHFDAGTCREPDWGQSFCMQPHKVYMANSSGPKIGLNRRGREARRWLDQGASEALAIVHAPTRRAAGVIEAHFKRQVNDRTDWRKLITGNHYRVDLRQLAATLRGQLPALSTLEAANVPAAEFAACTWVEQAALFKLTYPVSSYSPAERLILDADHPEICDNIRGLVGQYLLLSTGALNLADLRGHAVDVEIGAPFDAAAISNNDQLSLF